jgi:hypothetical protein
MKLMFLRPATLIFSGLIVLAGSPAFSADPDSRILGHWRKEGGGAQLKISFLQADFDTRRLYNGRFVYEPPKGPAAGKWEKGKFYTCEVGGADMCIEAGAMNCSVRIMFDEFKLYLEASAVHSGQYCETLNGAFTRVTE